MPRTFKRSAALAAAVFATAAFAGPAMADLNVDGSLGTLSFGSNAFSGTTTGQGNDADYYTSTNPAFSWGSEYVYSFTVDAPGYLTISTDDDDTTPVDNDFFLLNSLTTTNDADNRPVADAIQTSFFGTDSWGFINTGTYYLSIDAFQNDTGAFNGTLDLAAPADAPPSTQAMQGGSLSYTQSAGQVSWFVFDYDGGDLTIDTIGSDVPDPAGGTFVNDTELGLYDANGLLVTTDDDGADTGAQGESQIDLFVGDIPAGTYYLAVGTFNTVFNDNFDVTSDSADTGTIVVNGISTAVPEPTSLALLGLGGLALIRRRR